MTGEGSGDARRILRVDASARTAGSFGRALADDFIEALEADHGFEVARRDLAEGLPPLDAAWLAANTTAEPDRSPEQRAMLALSDRLIAELRHADRLVVVSPIYNFSIPASLKAWIDLICRARITFRYGESGPVGLLTGKSAVVILTSGGTVVGGPVDFASAYLRHVLGFIGITDVALVAADRLMSGSEGKLATSRVALRAIAADWAGADRTREVRSRRSSLGGVR